MLDKKTLKRLEQDKKEGKAPTTQAGEFVREEIDHIREGKHGARSTKQAIAIGLSKARRAGVDLPPPKPGTTSEETRHKAKRDREASHASDGGKHTADNKAVSPKRSKAVTDALKRESQAVASGEALSKQAHSAATHRSAASRSASARKAAATKGAASRSAAARKAARTRAAARR